MLVHAFFSFLVLLVFLEKPLVKEMVQIFFFRQNSFFKLELLQPIPRNSTFGYKERKINQDTHEREGTPKSNVCIHWAILPSFLASIFPSNHKSEILGILNIMV